MFTDYGSAVRARRKALSLKLREVAAATGCANSHVSNIERGLVEPSASERVGIDEFLNACAKHQQEAEKAWQLTRHLRNAAT